MGGQNSTPSSNPNSTTATMPPSNSPETHDSKPQMESTHERTQPESKAGGQESSDPPLEKTPENSQVNNDGAVQEGEVEEGGEGEEEEGECGFCLFMKGGGCRDVFTEWEKCVEAGEEKNEDIVEKCFEVTAALKKCMEAHSDYYAPLLQAEKAAQEHVMKELEEEGEKKAHKGVEESANVADVSDKDGVLSVSQQKRDEKDGP